MNSLRVQDLNRIRKIAAVLASNGFGHVFNLIGLGAHLPAGKAENSTKPYARRMRQVLVDLGPTFVKFGQILSVRPDLLPEDLLKEFESLQDNVPPVSLTELKKMVTSELGRPFDSVFSSIEPVPIGAASIAQVHRATLIGGHEVAIKVQRPGIEAMIQSDLSIMYTLVRFAEGRITLPGVHQPEMILREFDQAINRELDFMQEARAAVKMTQNFQSFDNIVIPQVLPQWSSRRLLVMEYIEGISLREKMELISPSEAKDIAHQLMDAGFAQVFDSGFFHGDPHPGNILYLPDGRLAFLDFGVTGLLTEPMKDTILLAFTSLVFRDAETFALTVYRAGATSDRVDLRAFRDACEKMMVKYHGASLDDIANRATLMEIIRIAVDFKIVLPAEFAILSRAMTILEGICRRLLPGLDIVEEVNPYAQRLIRQRFSPERLAQDSARLIFQAQGHLREFPTQLSQVLMDLEGGKLLVNVQNNSHNAMLKEQLEGLRAEITMGGLRISLGIMAATVSLCSTLFILQWSPTFWEIPIFSIFGFFSLVIGFSLFTALGVHVLFARWLNPAGWLRRTLGLLRFFSRRKSNTP